MDRTSAGSKMLVSAKLKKCLKESSLSVDISKTFYVAFEMQPQVCCYYASFNAAVETQPQVCC